MYELGRLNQQVFLVYPHVYVKWSPVEVTLQQHVSLDSRGVVLLLLSQLNGIRHEVGQGSKLLLFPMSNRQLFKLSSLGEHLNESFELFSKRGFILEVLSEGLNRLVLNVVEGSDTTEVSRL